MEIAMIVVFGLITLFVISSCVVAGRDDERNGIK